MHIQKFIVILFGLTLFAKAADNNDKTNEIRLTQLSLSQNNSSASTDKNNLIETRIDTESANTRNPFPKQERSPKAIQLTQPITVAIVGGGGCGTMITYLLARISEKYQNCPIIITLFERNENLINGSSFETAAVRHGGGNEYPLCPDTAADCRLTGADYNFTFRELHENEESVSITYIAQRQDGKSTLRPPQETNTAEKSDLELRIEDETLQFKANRNAKKKVVEKIKDALLEELLSNKMSKVSEDDADFIDYIKEKMQNTTPSQLLDLLFSKKGSPTNRDRSAHHEETSDAAIKFKDQIQAINQKFRDRLERINQQYPDSEDPTDRTNSTIPLCHTPLKTMCISPAGGLLATKDTPMMVIERNAYLKECVRQYAEDQSRNLRIYCNTTVESITRNEEKNTYEIKHINSESKIEEKSSFQHVILTAWDQTNTILNKSRIANTKDDTSASEATHTDSEMDTLSDIAAASLDIPIVTDTDAADGLTLETDNAEVDSKNRVTFENYGAEDRIFALCDISKLGIELKKRPFFVVVGGYMFMPINDKLAALYSCEVGASYPNNSTTIADDQIMDHGEKIVKTLQQNAAYKEIVFIGARRQSIFKETGANAASREFVPPMVTTKEEHGIEGIIVAVPPKATYVASLGKQVLKKLLKQVLRKIKAENVDGENTNKLIEILEIIEMINSTTPRDDIPYNAAEVPALFCTHWKGDFDMEKLKRLVNEEILLYLASFNPKNYCRKESDIKKYASTQTDHNNMSDYYSANEQGLTFSNSFIHPKAIGQESASSSPIQTSKVEKPKAAKSATATPESAISGMTTPESAKSTAHTRTHSFGSSDSHFTPRISGRSSRSESPASSSKNAISSTGSQMTTQENTPAVNNENLKHKSSTKSQNSVLKLSLLHGTGLNEGEQGGGCSVTTLHSINQNRQGLSTRQWIEALRSTSQQPPSIEEAPEPSSPLSPKTSRKKKAISANIIANTTDIVGTSDAPTVTNSDAPTVTNSDAPTVTTNSDAPTVTTNSDAPTVTNSDAPTMVTTEGAADIKEDTTNTTEDVADSSAMEGVDPATSQTRTDRSDEKNG